MKKILTSIAFLSRLPIPLSWQSTESEDIKNLSHFFWFAGLILGLINAIMAALLLWLLPDQLAIALFLGLQIVLFGAFHEDGFADLADAMGGYTIEKRLEIMKDSRLGTFGVSALIVLFLIRWNGYVFLNQPITDNALLVFLFLSGGWMRWTPILLLKALPYLHPSEKGIARGFTKPGWIMITTSGSTLLLLTAIWDIYWALLIILSQIFCAGCCYFFFRKTFGGLNGDCLGACSIFSEIIMLAFVCCIK